MNEKSEQKILKNIKKNFIPKPDNDYFSSFLNLLDKHSKSSRSLKNKGFHIDFYHKNKKTTPFMGYNYFIFSSKVREIYKNDKTINVIKSNENGIVVFEKTPFYPESGGQYSDTGKIFNKKCKANVIYVFKNKNDVIFHKVKIISGTLKIGDECTLEIDINKRSLIMKNHSCTHILHSTLKKMFGKHISQKGSSIYYDFFRFDFNFDDLLDYKKLVNINLNVNNVINNKLKGNVSIYKKNDILKNKDIEQHFQEKYEDNVRVVSFGNYSKELCSGTHLANTSNIEMFFIYNFVKKSANIYRVYAITSYNAVYKYFLNLFNEYKKYYSELKTKYLQFENNSKNLNIDWNYYDLWYQKFAKLANYDKFISADGQAFVCSSMAYEINNLINEIKKYLRKITLLNQKNCINYDLYKKQLLCKKINNLNLFYFLFDNNNDLLINNLPGFSDYLKNNNKECINIFQYQLKNKKFYTFISYKLKNKNNLCNVNDLYKELIKTYGGSGGGSGLSAQGVLNKKINFENLFIQIKNVFFKHKKSNI